MELGLIKIFGLPLFKFWLKACFVLSYGSESKALPRKVTKIFLRSNVICVFLSEKYHCIGAKLKNRNVSRFEDAIYCFHAMHLASLAHVENNSNLSIEKETSFIV